MYGTVKDDRPKPRFLLIESRVILEFGEKIGPAGIAVYAVLALHASRP